MAEVPLVILLPDECHWTLVIISQHLFSLWLGAVSQHAIAWASINQALCRLMASQGNELRNSLNFVKFVVRISGIQLSAVITRSNNKSTLVPVMTDGNTPLLEPLLSKLYVALWHHKAMSLELRATSWNSLYELVTYMKCHHGGDILMHNFRPCYI